MQKDSSLIVPKQGIAHNFLSVSGIPNSGYYFCSFFNLPVNFNVLMTE